VKQRPSFLVIAFVPATAHIHNSGTSGIRKPEVPQRRGALDRA
jgi:hypothetical protein